MFMEQRNEGLDRALIGRIVDRQIPRNRTIGTTQGLADASGVSRSTIYRVIKDADPTVSTRTFARIEAALELPADTLITAGAHDLEGLSDLGGVPSDLIAWIRKDLANSSGEGSHRVRGSA
jgi:transcriptional regulator with XRE-family HTH domain